MKNKTCSIELIQWHSLVRNLPRWPDGSPEMAALAGDIAGRGIDQPLIVTETDAGGKTPGYYYLLDGRHRMLAARQAGIEEVPVIVRPEEDAVGIVIGSLVQRRHYNKGALAYLCYPVLAAAAEIGVRNRASHLMQGTKRPKSTESTYGDLEDVCARCGFGRDLYFQARKVHEVFERRPDLREEYEARILSGEIGLGACVAGLAGKESTEGAPRQDRGPEQLLFAAFEALSTRFSRWDRLEGSTRRAVADRAVETVLGLPEEVQRGIFRALQAAAKR